MWESPGTPFSQIYRIGASPWYSFRYLCQCCLQVRPLSYRELLSFHVPLAFALTVPGKPYWLHSHWFSHHISGCYSEAVVFSAEEQASDVHNVKDSSWLAAEIPSCGFFLPPSRKCATVPKIPESLRKCHAVMNPTLVTFTVVHALFAMTLSSMLLNAIMMHSNSASWSASDSARKYQTGLNHSSSSVPQRVLTIFNDSALRCGMMQHEEW